MSWRIAIEHQEYELGFREPVDLDLRKGCAKQGDSIGEPGLGDAHNGPGAFNKYDTVVLKPMGTMGIVEDLGFGEVFWETPFAKP